MNHVSYVFGVIYKYLEGINHVTQKSCYMLIIMAHWWKWLKYLNINVYGLTKYTDRELIHQLNLLVLKDDRSDKKLSNTDYGVQEYIEMIHYLTSSTDWSKNPNNGPSEACTYCVTRIEQRLR